MNTQATDTYDVAIIGGGAAGLSAALVLARAGRAVVVVDDGQPRNAPAAHMHGFLSRDGFPPGELLDLGRAEVTSYGARMLEGTATELFQTPSQTFDVHVDDGRVIEARRVLVTSGLRDRVPEIEGVTERWGRDLLPCPYCDGHEVRDQPLGVLGGTPGAAQYAQLIRQWSADIVFFPHTTTITATEREQLAARDIGVAEGRVEQLVVEDDRLTGVRIEDGQFVPRAAIFVRPEFVARNNFVGSLGGAIDDDGWPIVDAAGGTTIPGLWAAGNAANPRAQVITAAGEGSAAAIAINNDLTEEDVRNAVETYGAGRSAEPATSDLS
jgi:thioredoxin reductase